MTCVYVSPHLDDAAFSCAPGIVARRAQGQRVVVLSVFSGGDPARAAEDHAALASVGVESIHLGLPDAPLRLGIEPSFRGLTLDPDPAPDTIEAVAEALRPRLAALQPDEIWWPLAIGRHVDHRAVFEASRRGFDSPRYYEERPYGFVPALVADRLRELQGGRVPIPCDALAIEAQIVAAGCSVLLGPAERQACIDALVARQHADGPDTGLRCTPRIHVHPGHGPAALALVAAYGIPLRWLGDGSLRTWEFEACTFAGDPFVREWVLGSPHHGGM